MSAARVGLLGVQQPQPEPWLALSDDSVRGELALRSLVAWAKRVCDDTVEQNGAVNMARGAMLPQSGHAEGRSQSRIGRIWVKGPHSWQR